MDSPGLEGVCRALYAFDAGRGIDLRRAEVSLAEASRRTFQHKSRAPLGEMTPPLRLTRAVEPCEVGPHATAAEVEVALYAQGAVCITWSIAFRGRLAELVELSALLYDHQELTARSRALVEDVVVAIEDAVVRHGPSGHVEDYVVFQVRPLGDPSAFLLGQRTALAQLLRAEEAPLATQEVEDATANPVSYEVGDLCLVDWLAAFLMGADSEDERLVLEFATVQLVQLRALDAHLDQGIAEAYQLLRRRRGPFSGFLGQGRELQRIARMQADDALLHEGIDNALKLFGDDYLARLFRTANERFHFDEWDVSIQRKLGVLESIYQSLSDGAAHRRAEALEWIIIWLIVIDIVIYFL